MSPKPESSSRPVTPATARLQKQQRCIALITATMFLFAAAAAYVLVLRMDWDTAAAAAPVAPSATTLPHLPTSAGCRSRRIGDRRGCARPSEDGGEALSKAGPHDKKRAPRWSPNHALVRISSVVRHNAASGTSKRASTDDPLTAIPDSIHEMPAAEAPDGVASRDFDTPPSEQLRASLPAADTLRDNAQNAEPPATATAQTEVDTFLNQSVPDTGADAAPGETLALGSEPGAVGQSDEAAEPVVVQTADTITDSTLPPQYEAVSVPPVERIPDAAPEAILQPPSAQLTEVAAEASGQPPADVRMESLPGAAAETASATELPALSSMAAPPSVEHALSGPPDEAPLTSAGSPPDAAVPDSGAGTWRAELPTNVSDAGGQPTQVLDAPPAAQDAGASTLQGLSTQDVLLSPGDSSALAAVDGIAANASAPYSFPPPLDMTDATGASGASPPQDLPSPATTDLSAATETLTAAQPPLVDLLTQPVPAPPLSSPPASPSVEAASQEAAGESLSPGAVPAPLDVPSADTTAASADTVDLNFVPYADAPQAASSSPSPDAAPPGGLPPAVVEPSVEALPVTADSASLPSIDALVPAETFVAAQALNASLPLSLATAQPASASDSQAPPSLVNATSAQTPPAALLSSGDAAAAVAPGLPLNVTDAAVPAASTAVPATLASSLPTPSASTAPPAPPLSTEGVMADQAMFGFKVHPFGSLNLQSVRPKLCSGDNAQEMAPIDPRLKMLFLLGTQKGGTTYLFRALERHQAFVGAVHAYDQPPAEWRKELHYFNRFPVPPRDGFLGCFDRKFAEPAASATAQDVNYTLLDATPDYMFNAMAPARIKALVPQARFVVVLRDPSVRAYSAWKMTKREICRLRSKAECDAYPNFETLVLSDYRLRQEEGCFFDQPGGTKDWHDCHKCHYSHVGKCTEPGEAGSVCKPEGSFATMDVSNYAAQLAYWLSYFPPDRFLVFTSTQLRDPESRVQSLNKIMAHMSLAGAPFTAEAVQGVLGYDGNQKELLNTDKRGLQLMRGLFRQSLLDLDRLMKHAGIEFSGIPDEVAESTTG